MMAPVCCLLFSRYKTKSKFSLRTLRLCGEKYIVIVEAYPDYASLHPDYETFTKHVGLHKRSVAGNLHACRERQSLIPAYYCSLLVVHYSLIF